MKAGPKAGIFAIDPGTDQSAYVRLVDGNPVEKGIKENRELLLDLRCYPYPDAFVCEMVACYGMPVGRDIFETCVWIGRFCNEVERQGRPVHFVYRKQIKQFICGSLKAKDSNIRQALVDMYPRTGGGAVPQIGTKDKPGPLYGFSRDKWQALAVAKYFEANRKAIMYN